VVINSTKKKREIEDRGSQQTKCWLKNRSKKTSPGGGKEDNLHTFRGTGKGKREAFKKTKVTAGESCGNGAIKVAGACVSEYETPHHER